MVSLIDKAENVKNICDLLINNKKNEAVVFAQKHFPLTTKPETDTNISESKKEYLNLIKYRASKKDSTTYKFNTLSSSQKNKVQRRDSKQIKYKVFQRDCFTDRYTGIKLLNPGILMVLHFELPEIFKYHKNWKRGECNIIYEELFATLDHTDPITNGGNNFIDNLVTMSWIGNSFIKNNLTIDQLGWEPLPTQKSNLNDCEWDGLTKCFSILMNKNDYYKNFNHIPDFERRHKYLIEWHNEIPEVLKCDAATSSHDI